MTLRRRIGMITPSSNTVLEPVTQAMAAGIPGLSVHFARVRVVEISLASHALAQFDDQAMLIAAEQLADARVDVIAWNGTSSGWLGFERDQLLCERITHATGIPATTSMLALNNALRVKAIRRYGLVTPYRSDVQARIVASYKELGLECVAEAHLDLTENFAFAAVDEAVIRGQAAKVACATPQAIIIVCTNLNAAGIAPTLEAEHGVPVYDSTATAMWSSLHLAGIAPESVVGWGSLFGVKPV